MAAAAAQASALSLALAAAAAGLVKGGQTTKACQLRRNDEVPEEILEATRRKSSVKVLSPLGVPCWELPVGPGNCQLSRQAPSGV